MINRVSPFVNLYWKVCPRIRRLTLSRNGIILSGAAGFNAGKGEKLRRELAAFLSFIKDAIQDTCGQNAIFPSRKPLLNAGDRKEVWHTEGWCGRVKTRMGM